jgi:nucleotide-binding universal stress UspA family protein
MAMLVQDAGQAQIVEPAERQGIRRVLVVLDGSPGQWAALRKGIAVAARERALLTVAGVAEDPPCWFAMSPAALPYTRDTLKRDVVREVERQLAAARDEVPAEVSVTTRLVHGRAGRALAALAKAEGFDLVIAAPRRARRLRRALGAAVAT